MGQETKTRKSLDQNFIKPHQKHTLQTKSSKIPYPLLNPTRLHALDPYQFPTPEHKVDVPWQLLCTPELAPV